MAETSHAAYNIEDMGEFSVENMLSEKNKDNLNCCNCNDRNALAVGYIEMSRINLELAEEAVALDNEALELCQQKFAECE